jgi:predicted Zn-dependent protease with MMP-like domain
MLDADDPDVLLAIESVVIHEVGHTLGLRHNFMAAATGNTERGL